MLIDSHCHLNYFDNIDKVLTNAKNAGIGYFLSVCARLDDFPKILAIANKYPHISITVGLHPTEQVAQEPTIDDLIKLGSDKLVIGIGETGLDYSGDFVPKEVQKERFRKHIRAALALNKPLIIHTREAAKDTMDILRQEKANQVGGIMHCFTESFEVAKEAIALNFYIAFSGIITFPKATKVQEVAKLIPIDRILVETDAPYLAPIPYRGKKNEPALIKHTAEQLAQLKNIPFDAIAKATTSNFCNLFKLGILSNKNL